MTLPRVPTAEELQAVLACCRGTFEGVRNYAMILTFLDTALRATEVLHLLIEHLDPRERSLTIRSGKGARDRVVFIAPATLGAVQNYLALQPGVSGGDWLFADAKGRPLKARHLVQVLHRLSARAGLPRNRRLHPHLLRHFAATSWIRAGMGLDQVRRLLGHATLSTTLRYLSLVSADLQRAHRDAAAIERLGVIPDSTSRTPSRRQDAKPAPALRLVTGR